MSKSLDLATKAAPGALLFGAGLLALQVFSTAYADAGQLGLGREATPAEVAAWDIDVRPDGQGLPLGQGTVAEGEEIYLERCAACHGDFGEGIDRWPVLSGGGGTLDSDDPVKTVGSYWPYLSTVYDYVHRAMPYGDAQSMTDDEVYAVVAYILYLNDLADDDFTLSHENFASIELPNVANFEPDARPDTPTVSHGEPCMTDCKPEVTITMRARILDVTPDEDSNPTGALE